MRTPTPPRDGPFLATIGPDPESTLEQDAPAMHDVTSVTYIGGCQRSGSTMLDRFLGQVPGYVSAGEVVHLWTRGLQRNESCGCGEPFR